MRAATYTIVDAGRMARNTIPFARPTSSQALPDVGRKERVRTTPSARLQVAAAPSRISPGCAWFGCIRRAH